MQQFAALPQRRASSLFPVALLALVLPVTADPVINEIFYHEDHGINPENVLTEWIELHNPTPAALDLSNWTLSRGVSYVFPPGTNLPANGYLVVAADTPAFNAAHPGIDNGTNVFGPWIGRLQNSGETIELEDAAGRRADRCNMPMKATGPSEPVVPLTTVTRAGPGWPPTMGVDHPSN